MKLHKSVVQGVLVVSAFGLVACQQTASDEVSAQVEQKLSYIHATSTPVPSPKMIDMSVQTMEYQGRYNPFVSPFRTTVPPNESLGGSNAASKSPDSSNGEAQAKLGIPLLGKLVSVDIHRPKQPLEQYSLAQLRYAGVLEQGGRLMALVKSSDGVVHRVEVGQYLGQNHGKVVSVGREQIVVSEAMPQADGRHYEQMSYLRLSP